MDQSTQDNTEAVETISKPKSSSWQRTTFILLNILMLFVFIITLAVVCLWPEHLPKLHLTVQKGLVVLMIESSILLLLGACQHSFSNRFRIAALFGSIIVAVESVIMVVLGGN